MANLADWSAISPSAARVWTTVATLAGPSISPRSRTTIRTGRFRLSSSRAIPCWPSGTRKPASSRRTISAFSPIFRWLSDCVTTGRIICQTSVVSLRDSPWPFPRGAAGIPCSGPELEPFTKPCLLRHCRCLAKVDLYAAFVELGLKKAEFACHIRIPKTHIGRLFSLRHHSRLDQIESAFAALGKRLHVEARNAA